MAVGVSPPDIIVVTGAAGALGGAVVAYLAEQGHRVVGVDIADNMADRGQAGFIGAVDLTDQEAVAAAFDALSLHHGRIAGLVNVAGGFQWALVDTAGHGIWDKMFQMNVLTAVNCTRAALVSLREAQGAIVNVAAAAALKSGTGMAAYAASKSGVMRLTESLAEEEKDQGVRVNAVLPSIVDTDANRRDMPCAAYDRWVRPEALAAVIAFLLSDGARAITGACIPVCGRC